MSDDRTVRKCTDAEKQILTAWQNYRRVEKYGLTFGKVCYHWQQKFAERGQRIKGRGVVPILEQLKIPVSTAYWWIDRWKESVGIKDPLLSSESQEWYTPPEIIDRTVRLFSAIDLDPCSNPEKSIPAKNHFTQKDDGLKQVWRGKIYMNPPYGDAIGQWTEKLLFEFGTGNTVEAVALVPARVDTAWFRPFRYAVFVSGRLKFSGVKNSAPFPSALLYLGANAEKFRIAFSDLGDAWRKDE